MKRNITYFLMFFAAILTAGSFVACVNDDDFSIPVFEEEEPDVVVNFSLADALGMITAQPVLIESEEPLYLEGYVVSDDEPGNFHKNFVIQDRPENPTAGITISTHAINLYTVYGPGRKVYFRVDGLYVGVYRGLPSIGLKAGDEIERMSVDDFDARILRSAESAELVPTVLTIDQLSNAHLNTLIQFNNVEFAAEHIGGHYGNLDNNLGVDRIVKDCDNNTVIMRNSGYADFRTEPIPVGNGTLVSVLSVFNANYQLLIRGSYDVDFENERCDGDDIPGVEGGMPFLEDFSSAAEDADLALSGWTNQNVNNGNFKYRVREYSGNKYVQISAHNSNENPFEVWMVTPGITLDRDNPHLSFDTKDAYWEGEVMSVMVSTDFAGDATTATWVDLTDQADFSVNNQNWPNDFTNSGNIDLSAYEGQEVFIGFRYLGEHGGRTTTYQIDNISVRTVR